MRNNSNTPQDQFVRLYDPQTDETLRINMFGSVTTTDSIAIAGGSFSTAQNTFSHTLVNTGSASSGIAISQCNLNTGTTPGSVAKVYSARRARFQYGRVNVLRTPINFNGISAGATVEWG